MKQTARHPQRWKKAIGAEVFVFLIVFVGIFLVFTTQMGLSNALSTMMNTAFDLLINTVLYLTAICVIMGAIAALFSEFGLVTLVDRLLRPLMKPIWGLPGAASLAVVTTFLSDNPAVLSLADDSYFRHFFRKYQFPALTNVGTAFGMGLIVCTFMLSMSIRTGESYVMPVAVGFAGAVVGSIVSTRLMLLFSRRLYGAQAPAGSGEEVAYDDSLRPVRSGSVAARVIGAMLDGGESGVRMGISIVPGVLLICTLVMMLTNGPSAEGYTGAAYEGIELLPHAAERLSFILQPLFGFTTSACIGVPVTALGAAGAAIGLVPGLLLSGQANANDVAVFTAMCMCWSGYLSTHVSMMASLGCEELTGKSVLCHTIGGLCAGVFAHYAFVLASLL